MTEIGFAGSLKVNIKRFEKGLMKIAREYQTKADELIFEAVSKGIVNNLLVMATGLGKTVVSVKVAERFKNVLFIVDSEELAEQAALAFLREKFDESFVSKVKEIGFVNYVKGGGLFALNGFKMGLIKETVFEPTGNVVVASIQTLHRRLHLLHPEAYDCVIVDEAHCFMAKTYFKGVNHFTPKLRLGMTATPQRLDNLPLSDLFEQIVFEYNIDDGIKNGYLVELNAIRIKTNCSLDNVKTLGGEFNQKDLSNEINTPSRNYQIADSYLQYCKGRKALGFGIDIQHCLDLAEAFQLKGINASAISSDEERTGDRKLKWKQYQSGLIDVLWNVGLLTKGVDSPETSCIINGRPTKSISLYMQIIGRGTRPLPDIINGLDNVEERVLAINKSGKKDCVILDIVDSTTRHSLINAWELDRQKPIEDRTFVTRENKDKLLFERAKKKLEHVRVEDEKVNLLSLPTLKISTSFRMEEDATPAQLAAIAKLDYDIENTHYSKSMISEIFGKQAASDKSISFLRWKGYRTEGVGIITVSMAQAAMKEIEIREGKNKKQEDTANSLKKLPFKGL